MICTVELMEMTIDKVRTSTTKMKVIVNLIAPWSLMFFINLDTVHGPCVNKPTVIS